MHLDARSRAPALLVILVAYVTLVFSARANGLNAGATDKVALNIPADLTITTLGLVAAAVPAVPLGKQLVPARCRWCDGPTGTAPNPVDGFFHDALTSALLSRKTADRLSTVTALTPIAALAVVATATGPYATDGAGLRAAGIVLEVGAVSEALTQWIKLLPARARPFAHYGHPGAPDEGGTYDLSDPDSHLSFPSGHTTIAAALGTGAAMVASLEDSPAAPWLWGAAGVFTVSTATLRMVAEKHYFTDVLAGAAIGAGCGLAIPLLHRRGALLGDGSAPAGRTVAAGHGGMSFSFSGTF